MTPKHPWLGLVVFLVRSRDRRGGHDAEDCHLVCDPHETKLESTKLDFRPGLVIPLFLHGGRCVAGLAARRFHGCKVSAGPVRRSTRPERALVLHLLRPWEPRPRVRGSASALDGNRGDDGNVLADFDAGRNSVRALLGLGQLCQRFELHDLATQRLVQKSTAFLAAHGIFCRGPGRRGFGVP